MKELSKEDQERNWIEDFSHENGNYMCSCVRCFNTFIGHKRRVVCKKCTTPHLSDVMLLCGPGSKKGTSKGRFTRIDEAYEKGFNEGYNKAIEEAVRLIDQMDDYTPSSISDAVEKLKK